MPYLIGLVVIIVLLKLLVSSRSKTQSSNQENSSDRSEGILPYQKKDDLLTKAEFNFYKVLKLATENVNIIICPMVRLADVVYVGKTDSRQSYFNKIKAKHIDFVICNDMLQPLLAIELDDSSHKKANRVERDVFFDEVLKVSGLPLIRFNVSNSYTLEEIRDQLTKYISPIESDEE